MGMVNGNRNRNVSPGRAERGYSLVELLVASFILLIVILGIIPLFLRSMQNNSAGNDYTRLSNFGKSQMEELFQLDFSSARLTIPAGSTEVSSEEYWAESEHVWKAGPTPAGVNPMWTRTTVVRQYHVASADKTSDNFDFAKESALDGGAAAESVHLKEVIVTVQAEGGSLMGPRRDIVLRTLKAK